MLGHDLLDHVDRKVGSVFELELVAQRLRGAGVGRRRGKVIQCAREDLRCQLPQSNGLRANTEFIDQATPIGLVEELRYREGWSPSVEACMRGASTAVMHHRFDVLEELGVRRT